MKIEKVKKLTPTERLCYWIQERHEIYLRRKAGQPRPWTDDEVLQRHFFTNPYRENDKTTVWFRENVREPLCNHPDVLMATVIFRWFNLVETGQKLCGHGGQNRNNLLRYWNPKTAIQLLDLARSRKEKIFTGAYIINSRGTGIKHINIVDRIDNVWKDRACILDCLTDGSTSMETASKLLSQYDGLGGFMSYEIVCDLRYTYVLERATDKFTWCNPGPGAIRGLYRVFEMPFTYQSQSSPSKPKNWLELMQRLLATVRHQLSDMPTFEMREVEHSLCEFDKYERCRLGQGKTRAGFNGT